MVLLSAPFNYLPLGKFGGLKQLFWIQKSLEIYKQINFIKDRKGSGQKGLKMCYVMYGCSPLQHCRTYAHLLVNDT